MPSVQNHSVSDDVKTKQTGRRGSLIEKRFHHLPCTLQVKSPYPRRPHAHRQAELDSLGELGQRSTASERETYFADQQDGFFTVAWERIMDVSVVCVKHPVDCDTLELTITDRNGEQRHFWMLPLWR